MHEVIDILKTPQCKWELELLSWILLDTDTKLKSLDKNLGNLNFQEFLKQGENIFETLNDVTLHFGNSRQQCRRTIGK